MLLSGTPGIVCTDDSEIISASGDHDFDSWFFQNDHNDVDVDVMIAHEGEPKRSIQDQLQESTGRLTICLKMRPVITVGMTRALAVADSKEIQRSGQLSGLNQVNVRLGTAAEYTWRPISRNDSECCFPSACSLLLSAVSDKDEGLLGLPLCSDSKNADQSSTTKKKLYQVNVRPKGDFRITASTAADMNSRTQSSVTIPSVAAAADLSAAMLINTAAEADSKEAKWPAADAAYLSAVMSEDTSQGHVFSLNGSERSYSSTYPRISPLFSDKEGISGLLCVEKGGLSVVGVAEHDQTFLPMPRNPDCEDKFEISVSDSHGPGIDEDLLDLSVCAESKNADPQSTTKKELADHPFSCISNSPSNDGASFDGAPNSNDGASFDGAPSKMMMIDLYFTPIKTQERMKEKVLKYSFPHPWSQWPLTANIRDPIRISIACDDPSHILQIVRFFLSSQESTGLRVVRVKNKFSQADADVSEGFNGLDVSLNVVFEEARSGLKIIGEIQLHDKQILQVKSRIHKLYKIKRSEDPSMIS
jgi:hypothetical protein